MKQKKWKHCPVCGYKNCMKLKKNLKSTYKREDYPSLTIKGITGYQCQKCKEALLTIKECRKIDSLLGQHMAKVDSKRVVAADLTDISTATKILRVSRQRVHQLMDEGKIHYVYVEENRLPIKDGLNLREHP